jgi:hypothetical protein
LKKKKKCDRASADANASEQRIIKANGTEFLIPSSRKPEDRKVNKDRQCRARFDNETAETFANVLSRKTCENLMSAVKDSGDDRIPEPSCHKQECNS